MRTQITETSIKLWFSAGDTHSWAHRPGQAWLGSILAGRRLFVEFDANGLLDLTVNDKTFGHSTLANELNAITSDFLRDKLPEDHPLYFITVRQFNPSQKEQMMARR